VNGFTLGADGGHAAPVGEAHRAELEALFRACGDYVRLSEGRDPGPAQVDELLFVLPPGRSAADKHVLGIRDGGGALVGVLDVVRDYPAPREWFLGLLMLAPGARGGGLGERILGGLEAALRAEGASALWLAVLEQNPRARRFWERLGFVPVDTKRILNGALESVAVRMVKRLGGSA
jgi:ribosomal protein S18 acetylase RimI-like enzyme